MTQEEKPSLQIIDGGKDTPITGRRSARLASGLTVKQEAFAQAIAAGLSNADAYRQAYDASKMKSSTIHSEASRIAALPAISERVAAIIEEKRRRNSIFTDKQREKYSDRVWRNLWAMIDAPDTPPAVKANLLSLGAKAAGMLTEQVKIENISADSKTIEAELIERLQRLTA